MYEDRADHLSNNLRLNEISILIFFRNLPQNKQKPIRNSCRNNLWSKSFQYFEILNLKFCGKNLEMKCVGFHSNSRGTDEIKDLPISIDFQT